MLRAVGRHEPVTTGELSRVLGGHENTTRQHLEALARDGYLSGVQNRGGMGRPSVSFSLSPSGLSALAGRAASPEHTALVATIADHIVSTSEDPAASARAVGLAWGKRLGEEADTLAADQPVTEPPSPRTSTGGADPMTEAVELLDTLGFSPLLDDDTTRHHHDGRPDVDVILRTCPLLDAARERPEVVCTVHEGLVEGFLRARGTEADVAVEPFAARLGCRASIRTA